MPAKKQSSTARYLSALARERERRPRPFDTRFRASSLLALFTRQKLYLFWTGFIMAVQLGEMIILAAVHYVYFPPVSLELLRFLSGISVLSLLASFWMRNMQESEAIPKALEIPEIAKCGFLLSVLLALALAFGLVFGTNLAVVTPPIYRAVLLSSLIVMPFDILTSFLFYNLNSFSSTWRPRWFRSISVVTNLLALYCLIYDLPLAYFLFKLLPRLFFVMRLWTKTTKRDFSSLFSLESLSPKPVREHIQFRSAELLPACLVFLCSELTFLYAYRPITRLDPNFAVLLFIIHKLGHILTVLSLKTRMGLSRNWRIASLLKNATLKRSVRIQAIAATGFYFLVTLVFAPAAFLKSNLAFWMSPTGELTHINGTICALGMLLVCARGFFSGTTALLLGKHQRRGVAFATAACSFLVLAFGILLIPRFEMSYDASSLLSALFFADILAAVLSALLIEKFGSADREAKQVFPSLASLLSEVHQLPNKKLPPCALIQFATDTRFSDHETRNLILGSHAPATARLAQTGPFAFLFIRFDYDFADLCEWRERLLNMNADSIDSVQILRPENSFAFASYFSGRKGLPSELERIKRASRLLQSLESGTSPENVIVLKRENAWLPDRALSYETELTLRRFLERFFLEQDFLAPSLYRRKLGKGFLHRTARGQPETIWFFPPESRGLIDSLRALTFEKNLSDSLKVDKRS